MATVYKKISTVEAHNKPVTPSTESDKTVMKNVINNFITYFKSKHLS